MYIKRVRLLSRSSATGFAFSTEPLALARAAWTPSMLLRIHAQHCSTLKASSRKDISIYSNPLPGSLSCLACTQNVFSGLYLALKSINSGRVVIELGGGSVISQLSSMAARWKVE